MKKETKESLKVFFLLAIVTWISHFLYFKRFGLYEDDFGNIGNYIGRTLPGLIADIKYRLTYWVEGHPLSFMAPLLAFIGDKLGGVYMMYFIAFVIVTINSFLMYKILKKVFPESTVFAVSGALALCLFPPDTTKMLLLHSYILQMSLMFLLTATLLYLKNWKILSYFVILMSLFSYESLYVVFFAVPFLKGNWDKKFRNEMIRHVLVLCLIIVIAFIHRMLTGESRVLQASSDFSSLAYKIPSAMVIGPFMNWVLFLRAPVITVIYWLTDKPIDWYYNLVFYFLIIGFGLLGWFFYKSKSDYISSEITASDLSELDSEIHSDKDNSGVFFRKIYKLFLAALLFLCLGYALSFTKYPPVAIKGRITSVHVAATFGGSVLFACMFASAFFIAEKHKLKNLIVILFSLYLTFLIGYKTITQKEFVQSWIFQKSFWSNVIKLCPDLKDNTVIIAPVKTEQYFSTKYIYSFSGYSDRNMLSFLFKFPVEWKNPPMYNTVWADWKENISESDGQWKLKVPYFPAASLQDSNVILLLPNERNEYVRIDSSVTINGKKLNLKPKGESSLDNFEKTPLYDLMINPR